MKGVSGQREAANLCRAAIQDVKQHPLAPLHAHRFAVSEHSSVDREGTVANLEAVRHALRQRGLHRRFPLLFQLRVSSGGGEEIHRHVAAAAECGFELF